MFDAIPRGAIDHAPARVAAGFDDHVAYGLTAIGLVVDVLGCGTFVCALRDPETGRVFERPYHRTDMLRVVPPPRS